MLSAWKWHLCSEMDVETAFTQAFYLQQTGLHNQMPAMMQEQAAKAKGVCINSNV